MKISEVSELVALPLDTLRYYERIGLIPPVNRDRSGVRDYSENDCRWVVFIKYMRRAGLSVESLVEYVGLFMQGDSTRSARKEILREQREKLAARIDEMQTTLEKLDNKIANYDGFMQTAENNLLQQDQVGNQKSR